MAELTEKAGVLNRDHRLVGKGPYELDLLLGERPHGVAGERDRADRSRLTQQWNTNHSADSAGDGGGLPELRIAPDIRNLHDLSDRYRAAAYGMPINRDRVRFQIGYGFEGDANRGVQMQTPVSPEKDSGILWFADPGRGLDGGFEHGDQLGVWPADDLQHIAGRGLVFERLLEIPAALAQFAEQPCVLHRDDCLVGE